MGVSAWLVLVVGLAAAMLERRGFTIRLLLRLMGHGRVMTLLRRRLRGHRSHRVYALLRWGLRWRRGPPYSTRLLTHILRDGRVAATLTVRTTLSHTTFLQAPKICRRTHAQRQRLLTMLRLRRKRHGLRLSLRESRWVRRRLLVRMLFPDLW